MLRFLSRYLWVLNATSSHLRLYLQINKWTLDNKTNPSCNQAVHNCNWISLSFSLSLLMGFYGCVCFLLCVFSCYVCLLLCVSLLVSESIWLFLISHTRHIPSCSSVVNCVRVSVFPYVSFWHFYFSVFYLFLWTIPFRTISTLAEYISIKTLLVAKI